MTDSFKPRKVIDALAQLFASAVATKEATDGDSNWLLRQPANATAVAIRKARRLANGWRKQAKPAYGYRILTPARPALDLPAVRRDPALSRSKK